MGTCKELTCNNKALTNRDNCANHDWLQTANEEAGYNMDLMNRVLTDENFAKFFYNIAHPAITKARKDNKL